MFFEHLDDQLKKEAATRVPVRAITAAILEAEQKFGSFLSENREERLAFVTDQIEEICIRQASAAGLSSETVIPHVMEHLASSEDIIYVGIEDSEVTAPLTISPSESIGGGEETEWKKVPHNEEGQKERYKNRDVEDKQNEWHGDRQITTSFKQSASPSFEEYVQMVQQNPAAYGIQQPQNIDEIRRLYNHMHGRGGGGYRAFDEEQQMMQSLKEKPYFEGMQSQKQSTSEKQKFEYGGDVDDQSLPPSNKGTRYEADSFDPNKQNKDHKGKGYKMVGGPAGGDTNPESHENIDTGNAKKVNPRSMKETEKKKKEKKNSSFSLEEAERYHALRQSGVSHDDAEYIIKEAGIWSTLGGKVTAPILEGVGVPPELAKVPADLALGGPMAKTQAVFAIVKYIKDHPELREQTIQIAKKLGISSQEIMSALKQGNNSDLPPQNNTGALNSGSYDRFSFEDL
jgi:hypothetical protein